MQENIEQQNENERQDEADENFKIDEELFQ